MPHDETEVWPATYEDHGPCVRVHLDLVPSTVRVARRLVGADLAAAGLGRDVVDTAVLVASELASNAVQHDQPFDCGHYELTWCLAPDLLRITLHDAGDDPAVRDVPRSAARLHGGRLAMIRAVCSNWHSTVDQGGVRVTAEIAY